MQEAEIASQSVKIICWGIQGTQKIHNKMGTLEQEANQIKKKRLLKQYLQGEICLAIQKWNSPIILLTFSPKSASTVGSKVTGELWVIQPRFPQSAISIAPQKRRYAGKKENLLSRAI